MLLEKRNEAIKGIGEVRFAFTCHTEALAEYNEEAIIPQSLTADILVFKARGVELLELVAGLDRQLADSLSPTI